MPAPSRGFAFTGAAKAESKKPGANELTVGLREQVDILYDQSSYDQSSPASGLGTHMLEMT